MSVVVPAFNAGATIGALLDSLSRQEGVAFRFEVIVVDDGSRDDTAEVARRYAGVKVLQQPNAGPAAARNRGAREARGDVLVFVDADCEPAPDWLAALVRPIAENGADAVKGVYRTRQRAWAARFAQLEFEGRYRILARTRNISFVDSYSAAVRAEAFRAVGGFDPHFPLADNEDVDFSFKLARQGCKMVFCPQAVVYHRHPGGWRRYLALKLRRAYWRARVYRRFPEMMLSDTYTPQLLKLQVFLMAAFVPAAAAAFWWGPAWAVVGGLAAVFLLTTIPFVVTALVRDPPLVLAAPAALAARAFVFAVGGAAGLLSRRRYDLLFPTLYLVGDLATIAASIYFIYWLRSSVLTAVLQPIWHPLWIYVRAALAVAVFWVSGFALMGLYRPSRATLFMNEAIKTFRAVAVVALVSMAASYVVKFDFSRVILALFFLCALPLSLGVRYGIRVLKDGMQRRGYNQTRVIIVGAGEAGRLVAQRMQQFPGMGYRAVGFVDDAPRDALPAGAYLGRLEDLPDLISEHYVDEVVVAKPALEPEKVLGLVTACERTGAAFHVIYSALETVGGPMELKSIADIPLVDFVDTPFQPVKRVVKRTGDLLFALLTLPAWLPLLVAGAAALALATRRWPLVRVTTMGQSGYPFARWEFRTDGNGALGRFLARSRLYRLPWVLSVVAGTMSVVGPRPHAYDDGRRHAGWQTYRYRMKPGMTGLWLVMVRQGAAVKSELEFDFYYIKNQSVLLDAAIIVRTLFVLAFKPPGLALNGPGEK